MVIGVIYKYTSPSGKHYIGQTTNEKHRINTWFCTKYRYAGPKINRARAKYGPQNFVYEILHKRYYFNKREATYDLDKWEIYYIGYYDSFKNGYNSTIGGLSSRGVKKTQQQIQQMAERNRGMTWSPEVIEKRRKALLGTKHSLAATISSKNKRRSSGILKKVYQFDLSGTLVREWKCASEACEELNINIQNVYRATKTLGKYKGYYWRHNYTFSPPIIKNNSKKVYKRTLLGDIVEVYTSIREAAISMHKGATLISRCLNGKRDSAYGFIWTFN